MMGAFSTVALILLGLMFLMLVFLEYSEKHGGKGEPPLT